MVISGLHIGLLSLIAFIIARFLWSLSPTLCRKLPAQYVAVIFSIIVAFIYSLLAGFSLPTQRAMIMLFVVGVFWFFKKRISIARSLSVALVLILLLASEAIYSTSLWLSFSAVVFLVFLSVILQQYRSKILLSFLSQIYLAILLVPISVYFFGSFSLISIIANIVAIPLVSLLVVPLLFLCLVLSFLCIKFWIMPHFLLAALEFYLQFLTKHVEFVDYKNSFSFASLAIVIMGLVLLFLPIKKSLRLLGFVLCLIFFQPFNNVSKKYQDFRLHVFDTEAPMILLEDSGRSLLYISNKDSNTFFLKNSLKGYLKLQGISHLDYLIISANSGNNINIAEISNLVPIDNIITNVATNLPIKKCKYNNSFILKQIKVNLLGDDYSCSIDFKIANDEFLILDNVPARTQKNIYNLYNRVIKPNIIISSTILHSAIIAKFAPELFIYMADSRINKESYDLLKNNNVKIIDSYNNGALTIKLDKQKNMSIVGMFKNY